MEEQEAAAFYDEQKSRGSGAARFKHGLGFGPSGSGSQPQPKQQQQQQQQNSYPQPPRLPHLRPGMGAPGSMPGSGPPGLMPPRGPPPPFSGGMMLPPGHPHGMLGHRPIMPPGMPMALPGGPRPPFPFPGFPLPPAAHPHFMPGPPPNFARPGMLHPGMHGVPQQPLPPPGMPPPAPPAPGPPLPLPAPQSAPPLPAEELTAEEVERQAVEEELQQKAAEEERRRREEEGRRRAEEEKAKLEEERLRRRVLNAWTAHKAEDGQVYYYNTVTQESSWTEPAGFLGDAQGVAEQPRPVASVAVEGTGWSQVRCHDGRLYYYHAGRAESAWTVPPEVAAAKEDGRRREAERLQARMAAATSSSRDRSKEEEAVRREAIRKSSNAALLPEGLPKAQRVLLFKELLLDKGVTPFSRWEREVPKLEEDWRWEALGTLKERRAAFDEFCKATAVEQRRMKEERQKGVERAFATLLHEAEALERQLLLHRLLEEQEEEEGEAPAEGAEGLEGAKGAEGAEGAEGKEAGEKASKRAPKEVPSVEGVPLDLSLEYLEKYWGNDARWKEADEKLRARLFQERFGAMVQQLQAEREQRTTVQRREYVQLLQQVGVSSGSRWSKTKELLVDDSRYQAVGREQGEAWFREQVAQLQETEAKAAAAAAERRAREEAASAKLAAQEGEAERRRRKAAHADAVASCKTLLGEVVKDPEARWSDWRPRLEKDPQGRATSGELEAGEAEQLFREFTRESLERSTAAFRTLLEERLKPLLPPVADGLDAALPDSLQKFEAAAEMLEEDLRWARGPGSHRERMWRQCCEELIVQRNRQLGVEPEKEAERPSVAPSRRATDGYGRPPPPMPPPGRNGDYHGDYYEQHQDYGPRDTRGGYREDYGSRGDGASHRYDDEQGYDNGRGYGSRRDVGRGADFDDRHHPDRQYGEHDRKRPRY